MRLDKFLKVSRIIKRRTVAKEVCDNDRATINGQRAKAGSEVNPGDIITLRFGETITSYKVLAVKDHVAQSEANLLFEVV